MEKKRRKVPEINSSSTADIAFLLLIFFLLTTSMGTDRGIARRLPPPTAHGTRPESQKVTERNVLRLEVGPDGGLRCNAEDIPLSQLRRRVKQFVANPDDDERLPEKLPVDVPFFGRMAVTQNHVVILRCDRRATYGRYIAVQNELVGAYGELRDEVARSRWGKDYRALSPEEQEAVRLIYPQRISEYASGEKGGTR